MCRWERKGSLMHAQLPWGSREGAGVGCPHAQVMMRARSRCTSALWISDPPLPPSTTWAHCGRTRPSVSARPMRLGRRLWPRLKLGGSSHWPVYSWGRHAPVSRRAATVALSLLEQAAVLEPADANFHFNVGHSFHVSDRPQEALRAYARALEIKPGHHGAKSNAAMLLAQLAAQPSEVSE